MNLITADGEWIQSTLSRTDEQTIFDDCDISTHTDVLTDFIEYSNYFVTDGWTDLIEDDKSHCGSELTNMDGIQHLLMLYCVGINHEFWIALSVIMNGEAAVSPIMIFQHYLFRVHWDPGSVLVSFDYFDTCVWGAHSLEISSLTCMQLSRSFPTIIMTIDKTQNFSNFLHDETQVQSFMAHDLFHNNMTEISKLTHDSIEDFGIDDLGFTSTHDSTYHLMTKNFDIMTQNLINIFNIDIWIFLQN